MINNDGNNSNQPKETNNNNENTILSNLANNGEKKIMFRIKRMKWMIQII